MKLEHYDLQADDNFLTFEFSSIGSKGIIPKLIQFTLIHHNIYNLAFGDKDPATGEIDDLAVTDNGDSEKVLATVVAAVYAFCERFPKTWIYVTGSTSARTRLYRMGIIKYFDIVQTDFIFLGLMQNGWEPYAKGEDYQAFMVQRKSVNLMYEKNY